MKEVSKMYYIEDKTCYVSAYATVEFIQWAKAMCKIKGYEIVFVLKELVDLGF